MTTLIIAGVALVTISLGRVLLVFTQLAVRGLSWFADEPDGVGGLVARVVVAAVVLHSAGVL